MDLALQSDTLSKVEATLSGFDETYLMFTFQENDTPLLWPRQNIKTALTIGARFILELKNSGIHSVERMVEHAKKEGNGKRDLQEMHRLLESIIN